MKHFYLAVHHAHRVLIESSGLMVLGAIIALTWANTNLESYHDLVEHEFGKVWDLHLTPHFVINEALMGIFFALAGKEILEAFLKDGALHKKEARPLPFVATAGGMCGPAAIFAIGALILDRDLLPGTAIPTATDIAFVALAGKLIFGSLKHPVVQFLLVLAIADDAGGLAVLAIFYQEWDFAGLGIGAVLVAVALFLTLFLRKQMGVTNYLWYGIPAVICWIAFHRAGLEPAIALVPVVLLMPHAKRDFGIFSEAHRNGELKDTLNQFEHHMEIPVEIILFAFAFVNAGVEISTFGTGTTLVFVALVMGKPLGIFMFTVVAMKLRGYELPQGMGQSELLVAGMLAGIGFTVALFVAGVAFEEGELLDATRLGALASFGAIALSFGSAYLFRVGRFNSKESSMFEQIPSEA